MTPLIRFFIRRFSPNMILRHELIVVECEDTGLSEAINFSDDDIDIIIIDILVQDTSYYCRQQRQLFVSFDGEGQLTGAINQVTGRKQENLYTSRPWAWSFHSAI